MIVKEYYGKIYLTSRGIFVAREVKSSWTKCSRTSLRWRKS